MPYVSELVSIFFSFLVNFFKFFSYLKAVGHIEFVGRGSETQLLRDKI